MQFERVRRQVALCGVVRSPDGARATAIAVDLWRVSRAEPAREKASRSRSALKGEKKPAIKSIIQDADEKFDVLASTSTRSDGSFYFMDVPQGCYALDFNARQFESGRTVVSCLHAREEIVLHRLELDTGKRTRPRFIEVVLAKSSPSATGRQQAAAAIKPEEG
jgi:hypothetical protein